MVNCCLLKSSEVLRHIPLASNGDGYFVHLVYTGSALNTDMFPFGPLSFTKCQMYGLLSLGYRTDDDFWARKCLLEPSPFLPKSPMISTKS